MAHPVFLALSAATAVNTVNALRPFSRRSLASVPCYAFGSPTSELPLVFLGGQVVLTAVAAKLGAIEGWTGYLALGLNVASAAGLLAVYREARAAKEVHEAALTKALGADYADRVRHPEFPEVGEPFKRRPGILRTLGIRKSYAKDADIVYGPDEKNNLLDIWRRPDLPREGRAPVLIQMPGGQWTQGNKQGQAYPLMSYLAERGWICVPISYRLSPKHRWPAEIEDVKRAIAWVRENIAAYGGDPDFVVLTGGSAGGHLASLAALSDPGEFQPGFEATDTTVAAVVTLYGAYDMTNRDGVGHTFLVKHLEKQVFQRRLADDRAEFEAASPMSRVRADAPPFFVIHGHNDSMIPVEQGQLFAQRLSEASDSEVVYSELPGAQHTFELMNSTRAALTAEAVGHFLGFVYGSRKKG
ncbi:MAG: esterase [Pseudonocardiales bacterium]|nr:esterase [Pseudonocardiales bacterium]